MQFESGIVMLAGPLDENAAVPDYKALLAAEEADGVVFTDGRAHPVKWWRSTVMRRVCARRSAYFEGGSLKGTTYELPSVVMWYADGITYFLSSDTQPVDALVAIAESME
jgi:hypothetical protein